MSTETIDPWSLISFRGRFSRPSYTAIAAVSIVASFGMADLPPGIVADGLRIGFLYIFSIAQVKRCRDAGLSPFWALLTLVPTAKVLWWIYLAIVPKQDASGYFTARGYPHGASGIFACPTCGQKMRVRLPPPGPIGKCGHCSSSFAIWIDAWGKVQLVATERTWRTGDRSDRTAAAPSKPDDKVVAALAALNLGPDATATEIRGAYRRKIAEHHPDKVAQLGDKIRSVAEEESKRINAAYECLKAADKV